MNLLNALRKLYPFEGKADITRPVYVFANRRNAGDLLSAKGVKLAVGVKGTDYIIEGNSPQQFLKSFVGKNVRLIIGGGGLFMDTFSPFWEATISSGIKYVLFGVGVCDIRGKKSLPPDSLLRSIVLCAEKIWVRDSRSVTLIENICGIKPSSVICPSVYYVHQKYPAPLKRNEGSRPRVLYVHHRKLVRTANRGEDFVKNIVQEVCSLDGFDFSETDNICRNPDRLLEKYIRSDIIVSTRLHGCVFSYALNKPFIAISADNKIDSFIDDYCNAVVVEMKNLSPDILNKLVGQRLSILPRKETFPSYLEGIKNAGELIKRLFINE